MRKCLCAILFLWSTIAFAAVETCTLTLYSDGCSTSNTFTFLKGSSTTITAEAKYGYRFKRWSDGNTENPRSITLNSNVAYTAIYESNMDTITLASQDCEEANSFVFIRGTQTTLTARPRYGYHFVKWTDEDTNNPRTITTSGSATYTAVYEEDVPDLRTILLYADGCETPDTFNCAYNMLRSFEAIPEEHYHFVKWNDNNQDNPRKINVTSNASYTAFFAIDQHTISVTAENGMVDGAGVYDYGSEATITITPDNGYVFQQWEDGNTDNPRTITVTGDTTLVASLVVDITSNIEDADPMSPSPVKYLRNGILYILRAGKTYNVQGLKVE